MTIQLPPPQTVAPSAAGKWFPQLSVLSIIAWAVAVGTTVLEFGSYASDRDIGGISAPQIAQVASEFLVAVAPFIVVACAVTAAAIMSGFRKLIG